MRVAIVINTSWNIFNYRKGLIEALLAQGCEVIAIAPPDEYSEKLSALGCIFVPLAMDNKGVNPWKDLGLLFRFLKVYRTLKPDTILHYTIKPNVYGSLAAGILRIPCISNVSGLGTTFIRNGILTQVVKLLYRVAFWFPKRVFFQNQDDLAMFLQLSLLKTAKAGLLPGSGINLSNYSPSALATNVGPPRFLLISRLLVDKGIREFASACRILKSKGYVFEAHLVGFFDRASKYNLLDQEIQNWEKEGLLRFLGESKDVRVQISTASCVVLPSYREGTPRSLLEAMAMGRPIVTTLVPGCKEVLEDGKNGYFCEAKSSESLASAMEKILLCTKEQLDAMGQHGLRLVREKFDEQLVVQKYFEEIFSKS